LIFRDFYFPSGTEQYLGEAKGLSQCGQRAHGFAASKNLSRGNWSYVCCMSAKGSSKIKPSFVHRAIGEPDRPCGA
jgi:hypothetical protein